MEKICSVTVLTTDGRYVTCTDDPTHLGEWLVRTLERMNAKCPLITCAVQICAFSETSF